jgi:phenylpyruvate tautomerase PptA (4-oxalocrotonate tautomerase family)
MTIISVTSPARRISHKQRRALATQLTDAVLDVQLGQRSAQARVGFRVHFHDLDTTHIAVGGELLVDATEIPDAIAVDILVMAGDWPPERRAQAIRQTYSALCECLGMTTPSPAWWITFHVIDEGSWGARGHVLSVLSLLDSGVFTPERAAAIRRAIPSR